jgi:hypothetical protein
LSFAFTFIDRAACESVTYLVAKNAVASASALSVSAERHQFCI